MFSMCSELTPHARIPDTRIPQLMQPCPHPHHVAHLLQDEHVVVEELLQLLVAEVDRQLLKPVEVEDLKASNVQNTYIEETIDK